jgi:hypothetical protein
MYDGVPLRMYQVCAMLDPTQVADDTLDLGRLFGASS